MGEVAGAGEVVVDLYAGIGYYSLPILVHSRVDHVHCCEWNPNAVRALESNLESNGVAGRCTIHVGDNRVTATKLEGVADRVVLGLLPSAGDGYGLAMGALSPTGGVLHVHGVAATGDYATWVTDVTGSLREMRGGCSFDAAEPLRVKSYAPHWDHVVLDVTISGG